MKYSAGIISILALSVSLAAAQEMEHSEKPGMRRKPEDFRANMQERMKKHGGPAGDDREHRGGREEMMERMLNNPEIMEKLGISEENARKIQEELKKIQEESHGLRTEMEKLGMEQAKAMTAKELDEGRLMSLVDELGRVRTELAKIQIRKMILLRQNIDPEKMEAIRARMQERMRSRQEGSENGERPGFRDRMSGENREKFEEMRKKRKAREKDAENRPDDSLGGM